MQIANIEIKDFGNLFPIDENTARRIDLNKIMKNSWDATLLAILEVIMEYNHKLDKNGDKCYRFHYYLKTKDHDIVIPDFEYLDPSKTMLIISKSGAGMFRDKQLEIMPLNEVTGIGSDLFDCEGFILSQERLYGSKTTAIDNTEKIKEMRSRWESSRINHKLSIEKFMNDIEAINSLQSYNRFEFYNAKRDYIMSFLAFLNNAILKPDGSLTVEEINELLTYFNDKYEIKNTQDPTNNPQEFIHKRR